MVTFLLGCAKAGLAVTFGEVSGGLVYEGLAGGVAAGVALLRIVLFKKPYQILEHV